MPVDNLVWLFSIPLRCCISLPDASQFLTCPFLLQLLSFWKNAVFSYAWVPWNPFSIRRISKNNGLFFMPLCPAHTCCCLEYGDYEKWYDFFFYFFLTSSCLSVLSFPGKKLSRQLEFHIKCPDKCSLGSIFVLRRMKCTQRGSKGL